MPLGAAQDFKRVGDGDTGPEHRRDGRLLAGAVPRADADDLVERVHQPVVDELARRGTPFVGCLFAGLMLTDGRAHACSSSTPASATPRPRC